MSKYIDAEKLKAEIRKLLIPTVHDRDYDEWEHGKDSGFIEAISIIESLQQEQPEVDIWKEIHKYFNPHGMELQFDRSKGNTILKPEQLFNFASHFAEWGAIHLNARKEGQK